MSDRRLTLNEIDAHLRSIASSLQNSHVCDHDTGVLGLNMGSGYLLWSSGSGSSNSLGIDSERPALRDGSMPKIYARLAAGSADVTMRLVVNGANVAAAVATVTTAWTLFDFSQENTAFVEGDRLAVRYEGLTAMVDRMAVRVLWSLAVPSA